MPATHNGHPHWHGQMALVLFPKPIPAPYYSSLYRQSLRVYDWLEWQEYIKYCRHRPIHHVDRPKLRDQHRHQRQSLNLHDGEARLFAVFQDGLNHTAH